MRGKGHKVEAAVFSGALPSALWVVFLPGLFCSPFHLTWFYGSHDERVQQVEPETEKSLCRHTQEVREFSLEAGSVS